MAFILFPFLLSQAQQRCGTVEHTNTLRSKKLLLESDAQFEQWLSEKIQFRKQSLDQGRTQTTSYQIPIVIHIIHNGEPLGTGSNISDAQVLSQIKVLNDDFQRLNADATNTPSEFLSVAGSMNIQFVLAKQDKYGSPSNGIVRVNGLKSSWQSGEDVQLKALSYWPAEDYFNVWVCNLSDFLGYTQFPVSNLPGLENSSTNGLTDGIVVATNCFGTNDAGPFNLAARYNKGRSLTHETGHFLGLRHIWGDEGGCTGTDYVNDTPNQNNNTNGCPSNPASNGCTPTAHKMFQNYLDYTDDACMNIFTKGQVSRMITVLENSIRRKTLINSHGLIDPTPVPNDLGIQVILSPVSNLCINTVTPSIQIQNYGSNVITSATIQLKINSIIKETKTVAITLDKLESTIVDFASVMESDGNSKFQFIVMTVNNTSSGNPLNDTLRINTLFSTPIATPFQQSFSTLPFNWIVQNPDTLKTWQLQPAPFSTSTNTAMYLNYFDYQKNIGTSDVLISPAFNLTSSSSKAFLSFDVAYAAFKNTSNDQLRVLVLSDCNTDINFGTEIYSKAGTILASTTSTSLSFKPKNQNDWRKEIIDISDYLGQTNLRFAFVGTNDYGNNIYIDNVSTITTSFTDLAITSISNPSFVSCSEPAPKIVVQNVGTEDIYSFVIQTKINSQDPVITPINVTLLAGESQEIGLPTIALNDGENTVSFRISDPNNGGTDINPSNNQDMVNVIANPVSKVIPIRENFDSGSFGEGWFSVNPSNGMKWNLKNGTNYKASAYFNAFDDTTLNEEAWLISPMLDFSYARQASVFFDQSYALNKARITSEELKILASVGCGNEFKLLLYDSGGVKLANDSSALAWQPATPGDWRREYVRLDSLVGKKDVRLAFVVTNGNGNNIYIDNIEFYTDYNKYPLVTEKKFLFYPTENEKNPSWNKNDPSSIEKDLSDFHIYFTLAEQQTVNFDIYDMTGQKVLSKTLDHTLNQDYSVIISDIVNPGIYIMHVQIGQDLYIRKVSINK